MAQDDSWYSSPNWTDADQKLFYEKLSRSRGDYYKQQYARVKAMSLIKTNKPSKLRAAIELLDISMREWCTRELELNEARATIGRAYRQLGDLDKAVSAYEASITWHHTNSRHLGYWEYPEMIISLGITNKYPRALEIIHKLADDDSQLSLEIHKFIYHAVRAIVFAHQNNSILAYSEAMLAISIANVKRSIFRYHPTVGLVDTKKYKPLIKKLKRLLV